MSQWAADSSEWRERPVLVTGATGFLGQHLTAALVARGAHAVVLVRDLLPGALRPTWMDDVTEVRGEIQDVGLVERALQQYDVAVVFHLAAQTQVEAAHASPAGTFEANIRGTWSVLEAARRTSGVRLVVVASSDKAYGDHAGVP